MRNLVLLCLYVTVNGTKLKNKLCRGKTCRQCDNYVTANSQKTNGKEKTDSLIRDLRRLIVYKFLFRSSLSVLQSTTVV